MYLLRNRFTSGLLDCSRRRLHESQFSRSIGTLAIGAQGSQAPCYFAVHCQMRLVLSSAMADELLAACRVNSHRYERRMGGDSLLFLGPLIDRHFKGTTSASGREQMLLCGGSRRSTKR